MISYISQGELDEIRQLPARCEACDGAGGRLTECPNCNCGFGVWLVCRVCDGDG